MRALILAVLAIAVHIQSVLGDLEILRFGNCVHIAQWTKIDGQNLFAA